MSCPIQLLILFIPWKLLVAMIHFFVHRLDNGKNSPSENSGKLSKRYAGAMFVVCRNVVNNTRHCTATAAANKKIDPAKVKAWKQIKAS